MVRKKTIMVIVMTILAILFVGGCGGQSKLKKTEMSNLTGDVTNVVQLEVWGVNNGYKGIEPGSKLYDFYVDKLGVGIIHPYVEWDGGTNYLNQLNLRIASGEMPDLFQPEGGMEFELARNGSILDLTDLLPVYAPDLWKLIPQSIWDVVRSTDPTGQGRIYYVPAMQLYGQAGGFIRKDWLDHIGMSIPTTQADYVKALTLFRDLDMNGNGDPHDEIPTGGRSEGRWLDHLFNMYGIAMEEGRPDWDIYNQELTYSAVTPNMKDALQFIADLYSNHLIDQESFLNSELTWRRKISENKVGSYFHFEETVMDHLHHIHHISGEKANFSIMPVLNAPGYEEQGFVTLKKVRKPLWVINKNAGRNKIAASLKLLNQLANQALWEDLYFLVEGMHHVIKDGQRVMLPAEMNQQNKLFQPFNDFGSLSFKEILLSEMIHPSNEWVIEQSLRNLKENQHDMKVIAGDGMPESVYEGYPNIRKRTLYTQYARKIIIGEYAIDKFDEFVEEWYASGGDEVTKRAREWYSLIESKDMTE